MNDIKIKLKEKPRLIAVIIIPVLIIILLLCFLLLKTNPVDVDEELTWDVVKEPQMNPELTLEEQKRLCTDKANEMLKSQYEFKWDNWSATNYSATEESHQLKWFYYLYNESSILAQCNIESWRYKDTEVRVSFLPDEYYSLEKFNLYQKHCEDLWWKLKWRWWYGHWMIWSCELSNWKTCDLRDFYIWDCK